MMSNHVYIMELETVLVQTGLNLQVKQAARDLFSSLLSFSVQMFDNYSSN